MKEVLAAHDLIIQPQTQLLDIVEDAANLALWIEVAGFHLIGADDSRQMPLLSCELEYLGVVRYDFA